MPKANSAPTHNIAQPKLRDLTPDERIVRCAGLKFILHNVWKPGDVLDEQSAAFINTAWHTLILNRFSPERDSILAKPSATYEDLDVALSATAESYKWTPRPATPPGTEEVPTTEEERALIAYARPAYNAHMGGKGMTRKTYEADLRSFVRENRAALEEAMQIENASMKKLTASIDKVYSNEE